MKYRILVSAIAATGALVLATPAAAAGPEMTTPGTTTDVPPTPGVAKGEPGGAGAASLQNVDTKTYVQKAAMTDLFEVQAGKLALEKSKDKNIRKFAEQMVTDHTTTTTKLQAALKTGDVDVSPPTKLDAPHAAKLKELTDASGAEFDRTYVQMQVAGHQEALRLHQSYASSGDNATLKALAGKTAELVQHHLDEAKALSGNSG